MKYQVVCSIGDLALFEPFSFDVAYNIYRIMTAPPFIDSQVYLYIRGVYD